MPFTVHDQASASERSNVLLDGYDRVETGAVSTEHTEARSAAATSNRGGKTPYCAAGSTACALRMFFMSAAVLKSTSSTWNTRSELAGIGPDSCAP